MKFNPATWRNFPSLRRRDQTGSTSDIERTELEPSETSNESVCAFVPSPGHYCIVLGDSLQGYYLVKCLSNNLDSFSGKYLVLSGETLIEKAVFKETSETDTFNVRTVVSEVSVSAEAIDGKLNKFSVREGFILQTSRFF